MLESKPFDLLSSGMRANKQLFPKGDNSSTTTKAAVFLKVHGEAQAHVIFFLFVGDDASAIRKGDRNFTTNRTWGWAEFCPAADAFRKVGVRVHRVTLNRGDDNEYSQVFIGMPL